MSGKKEDKERLTDAYKGAKRYETTKMGVVLFVTCIAAIVSDGRHSNCYNEQFIIIYAFFQFFWLFLKIVG